MLRACSWLYTQGSPLLGLGDHRSAKDWTRVNHLQSKCTYYPSVCYSIWLARMSQHRHELFLLIPACLPVANSHSCAVDLALQDDPGVFCTVLILSKSNYFSKENLFVREWFEKWISEHSVVAAGVLVPLELIMQRNNCVPKSPPGSSHS